MLSKFVYYLPDGTVIEEERQKKALVPGVVPHIFENCPKYLSSRKQPRKSPKKRYCEKKANENNDRSPPQVIASVECLQRRSFIERYIPLKSM